METLTKLIEMQENCKVSAKREQIIANYDKRYVKIAKKLKSVNYVLESANNNLMNEDIEIVRDDLLIIRKKIDDMLRKL